MHRDAVPQETPQRMQNLLRSKEQLLNISNFIFGESPDVNGFAEHEAGRTDGKVSKSKLELKDEDISFNMATPQVVKTEQ
jgi:hypothetical protein